MSFDRTPPRYPPWAYAAGAVAVGILLLLIGRSCAPTTGGAAQKPGVSILTGPTTTMPSTTTARPAIDPLSGLGSPVNSTALAIVGPDYAARLELAKRVQELINRYAVTGCQVFIGGNATGEWELSTVWGASHPVPVFVACPFNPPIKPS